MTKPDVHQDALQLALENLNNVERDLMPHRQAASLACRSVVRASGEAFEELRGEGPDGRSKAEIIGEFVGGLPGFLTSPEVKRVRFETTDPDEAVNVRAATAFVTTYDHYNSDWGPRRPFYVVGADSQRHKLLLAQPPMALEGGGFEDRMLKRYEELLVTAPFFTQRGMRKFLSRTALPRHYELVRKEGVSDMYDDVRERYYIDGQSRHANVRFGRLNDGFRSLSNTDFHRYNVYAYLTNLAVTFSDTNRLRGLLEAEQAKFEQDA